MTESQIKNLPLEERQKIVLELKQTPVADKAYPNAKAIIALITDDRRYRAPQLLKVKALEDVTVDGKEIKKDQETEVYPWQYHALARCFEVLDKEFVQALEAQSEKNRKARAGEASAPVKQEVDVQKIATEIGVAIGKSIVEALKASKALPLLLLLGLLFFGAAATAQQVSVTYLVQTNDLAVAPYPGQPFNASGLGTNKLNGTSGIMAIAGQGVTNLYTPVPNIAKYRFASIAFWANQMSGTAADVSKVHFDFTPDASGTNWFNLCDISATAPGTTAKYGGYTNLDLPSTVWVRCTYITNAAATIMTNVILEVTLKPSQYGQ